MEAAQPAVYCRLAGVALLSRTFLLLVGYLSAALFGRYDRSTEVSTNGSVFRFLLSWDAVHFLHIADHGYTHEHAIPFFPLLPLLVRALPGSNNLTKGVVLNNVLFVAAALLLYKLSLLRYSPRIAMLSALFFVFNPASIVYSALYSECLFAVLFFIGCYHLQRARPWRAAVALGLSGLCRSNAVLFALFFRAAQLPLVLAPLASFQLYSLLLFWRATSRFRIFVPYSYIQRVYWNQGLFRFYQPCNIANMIYGLPFVLYSLYIIKEYAAARLWQRHAGKAAALPTGGEAARTARTAAVDDASGPSGAAYARVWRWLADPLMTRHTTLLTKLVLLLAIQIAILIFVVHWNTASRFISYNPFLYWAFAFLAQRDCEKQPFQCMAAFFATYTVLYAIFFSCFYPPA